MYTDELIGEWVGKVSTLVHKVESVINGQLITNCGRRLRTEGYEPYAVPSDSTLPTRYFCKQCLP